ncbi:TPA: hypothetical protein ACP32N_005052 [Pseudomonas aeruginosa]
MTTNNPNALELNRKINTRSPHEDERAAYERMQLVGFKIAQILMPMPLGTMADLGQGEYLFVADFGGECHIFSTPDWHDGCQLGDVNWFFQSDYQGLSVEDLDEHRADMERWLENPVFRQFKPADQAHKLIAKAEAEFNGDPRNYRAAPVPVRSTPSAILTRYDQEMAKRLIDGYMVPSCSAPQETHEQQFVRAKAELITHLELQLKQVMDFTYQDFTKK